MTNPTVSTLRVVAAEAARLGYRRGESMKQWRIRDPEAVKAFGATFTPAIPQMVKEISGVLLAR